MVLVILEEQNGRIKKSAIEAAGFASKLAQLSGMKVCGLCLGRTINVNELTGLGLDQIVQIEHADYLDSSQWISIVAQAKEQLGSKFIVLSNNSLGKSISGGLSVHLKMGLISNVVNFKSQEGVLQFQKSVFSGKASAWYAFSDLNGIIALMPNGFGIHKFDEKPIDSKVLDLKIPEPKIKLLDRKLIQGKTPLTEAEIVVSAGRGLKDPSNWYMVEELADILHATTACSRPVADAGWRPHHEHVGQTGVAIRPNVYIALGISGAIQHLAGVNNSKKIFVINKDPEAPFFKAADFGVCGDLFEILPKLNEALRKSKMN
ncbi:MAG: electron transfer flavoprotein subunit alpha/FixB family protein [Saprospiraceae bacterium]|nr:electron transfer flavoprotein subunit alpha/FixB family protein [Saprospiraceae bacterium]